MAEFKLITTSEIVVPERLRAVEEEHALAIAQSIVEHGLINPITVRFTPAAKGGKSGKWTLVAGAHRLRAFEINGEPEIEAMVVEGDKAEAQLIEITENLFRNELSVMDRAVFVQSYREIWEAKYGKITRGGDRSKDQVDPLLGSNRINLVELFETEVAAGSFSEHVADRMGLSVPAVKRLNTIAQNLHPALRTKLRGTPAADNQSLLLKIVKEGPSVQAGYVAALEHEPDIQKVMALTKPAPQAPSASDKKLAVKLAIEAAFGKADKSTQLWFIHDSMVELDFPRALIDQVAAFVRSAK